MEKFLRLFNNNIIYSGLAFFLLMLGAIIRLHNPFFQNSLPFILIVILIVVPIIIKDVFDKKDWNLDNKYFQTFLFLILFALPLFVGMSISSDLPFVDSILQLMLFFASTFFLTHDVVNRLIDGTGQDYNDNSFIYSVFFVIVLLIMPNVSAITNFLLRLSKPSDFIIIALTIVLLAATLSLLSFTYYMVLNHDEIDLKLKMRRNGEKFFKATLFSMIFLFCVFIIVNYGQHVHVTEIALIPLTFDVLKNFVVFSTLICISLISGIHIIYNLFCTIYCSLKELNELN